MFEEQEGQNQVNKKYLNKKVVCLLQTINSTEFLGLSW